ncbi:epidermal growth factor receptor isoform X2 [Dermatophagoides farinae]|uniref:epidermal growth factor receptor isoform X2 n=1 Tax=Dermatophagoides farinae TaxID=6954 RepID=UPI003F5FAFC5
MMTINPMNDFNMKRRMETMEFHHHHHHHRPTTIISTFIITIFLLIILSTIAITSIEAVIEERVCIGTNGRMSVPSNRDHHFQNLRDRYTNCTYVDGNLELTWLQDKNLDLSFLQYIREVTGYVLISHVDVKRIVLPSLQIIRGRSLFKLNVRDEEFALMVTLSKMENLEAPSLRDILVGNVGFFNNYNLCHIRTLNWDEILSGPGAKTIYVYNFTQPERACPSCHESCPEGCWGEGPHNCQKFSKIKCSPQCHQGRCFGSNPRECCHLFCAGGCTGPKQSDCLACRNFYDDGICKQECPPMMRYNPATYSWEVNPEGKYAYGATCVKNCPEHLLKDNGACVRSCPVGKKSVNGECVPCDGPCPKNCPGVDIVHSTNIDSFKGCTIIEGSITVLDTSFQGYQEVYQNFSFGPHYDSFHPSRLEVFSTLREITGYLNIQASHPDFKNLSYFRNLETVGGRTLTEYFAAIYIVKTSLTSLGLRSLKRVEFGSVAILENQDLCFASRIDWKKVANSSAHHILMQSNRNESDCKAEGLVCHSECASDGCWGAGPDECVSCKSYRLGETCVSNCNSSLGIYDAGDKICKHCHEECDGACTGPGPRNCQKCKHIRDGPFCVRECPVSKYPHDGQCKSCHENCVSGCTGPLNRLGEGGCNSCEKAIVSMYDPNVVEECLKADEPCPEGFYHEYIGPQEEGALKSLTGKSVCRKCHQRCKNCTAFGIHVSVCECLRYSSGEQCEDQCPRDHYADEEHHKCVKCADECRRCRGPTSSHCIACRNYRVYLDDEKKTFNCTATCPPEKPYKVFEDKNEDPFCSDKDPNIMYGSNPEEDPWPVIIGGGAVCIVLFGVFLAIFSYQWLQRARTKENTMKLTMRMTGYDDNEPLKPSNVKPNLAQLRIVKEAELRKGGILGFGAFGTVYKGVWVPEGENFKIPVAIKVLREGTQSNTNKEFLEEAYIMASVDHPNLLKLLAVCMTSQLMLVTQLMPLGCLLDYVRNNKDKIGSKPLLNWCTQIARGMAYLEEKRMVHRDLALRNVLLQTPGWVKITDFGLAKLLEIDEDEYKAAGGKMPIKWLALECIQHRIFTHKSDVWSFGVTVWELLTYGGKPYENVSARDVPDLLEKGERLPQPTICTIDVYMLMVKCWMIDPESRPSFKELAEEFAKMARDPGRYLVIKGDKLMRLPSYTQQDEKELIRSLSMPIEGPETIMDAEEYLQPSKSLHAFNGCKQQPPPTPIKKFMDDRGFEGDPINGGLIFGHNDDVLDSRFNAVHQRHLGPEGQYNNMFMHSLTDSYDTTRMVMANGSNSHHFRDTSHNSALDTLKLMDKGELNELIRRNMMNGQTTIEQFKFNLPVDEDDYLMPSPAGPVVNQVTYMEMMNGRANGGELRGYPINLNEYPNCQPLMPQTCIENPEYLLMNNRVDHEYVNQLSPTAPSITSAQTFPLHGMISRRKPLSSTSSSVTSNSAFHSLQGSFGIHPNSAGFIPLNPNNTRKFSSSEEPEESSDDHQYYNELDWLQRELQPLRRSETTV